MALPFDTITATTLQLIRRRMADNIFKSNNFGAWMLMKGRVQLASGGKWLQEPLMYATNGTVKAYRGYEKLDVAPTDELTAAQFAWRQLAVSMGISGLEELENDGPQAVFNVLRAKIENAEMSLRQHFGEKLVAATSTKDLTRDFLGLDELIEDAVAGSQSNIGGINRAVDTWWANQYLVSTTAMGGAGVLAGAMVNALNTIKKNHPVACDLILTDQTVYEEYESQGLTYRQIHDSRLVDLGFDNIKFKGATMMWNEDVKDPGGDDHLIYFISTEFLRIMLHKRRNFVMSNFVSPYDQDARVAQILVAGQTTINNSRFQGVLRVTET